MNMNHKWYFNKCKKCGLIREKKECKQLQRTHTYLSKVGIWEDKPIYDYRIKYAYLVKRESGMKWEFKRPNCDGTK